MVLGKTVDEQTRCVHYHSKKDIIAIKFKCCGNYYPCHTCHEEESGHASIPWAKSDSDEKAILCGVCRHELTIKEYLASHNQCPACHAWFNPDCSKHYHLYFEL